MTTFGTTVTDTAWNVLAHVGALEPVTYTHVPPPVRNLESGQSTAAGTNVTLSALVRGFRRAEIDGTSVVAGDILIRIPKVLLEEEPTTRDTITYNAVVWAIVSVQEGANAGWWRFQGRRVRPV